MVYIERVNDDTFLMGVFMSGDTLKRVQAIKKWLEKAEISYSHHKDITGEINLMMAQAEMKRLKETQKISPFRRWGLRGCAMIVAVGLFFGGHYLYQATTIAVNPISTPIHKEVQVAPKTSEKAPISSSLAEGKGEGVTSQREEYKAPATVIEEENPSVEKDTWQEKEKPKVIETHREVHASEAPVSTMPTLSEKEIQSVVGEAGRALRGQSSNQK